MTSSGWATESHKDKHFIAQNKGFMERLKIFAELDEEEKKVVSYKPEGGTLWGKLGVDLEANLINGLSVILEYTLADSNFFLMAERKDGKKLDKKFDIAIDRFTLHACSHEMAPSLYETIERRMKSEVMNLPFKRYHITAFSISSGLLEWLSDSLLVSPVLVPNRLIFCILPSRVYDCDQSTNPYIFGLGQDSEAVEQVTSTVVPTATATATNTTATTASTTTTTNTTGSATATTTTATASGGNFSNAAQQAANIIANAQTEKSNSDKVKKTLAGTKKQLNKIRKVACTMNGIDIDGLSSSSLDEISFFRLNKFLGYHSGTYCNSMSFEEFVNGSTMYVFDFSTSLNSGQDFLVPSLKTGHLRASIQFENPTKEAYHLLVLSEYNSNISIGGTSTGARTVSSNYFI